MKKRILTLISILSIALGACSSLQAPEPTATPLPPTATATITPVPATATQTATFTPSPTATQLSYSELPGWFAFIDYECNGLLCTNISIIRPDISNRQILTDHDDGLVIKLKWSPNGQYIAYEFFILGEGAEMRVYDLIAQEMTILTSSYLNGVDGFSWSPDSRYIIFGNVIEQGGGSNIQRIEVQNKRITNLTTVSEYRDVYPAWSPDGTQIVFSSNRPGVEGVTDNIWSMAGDGSGLVNLTASDEAGWQESLPSWSPDGSAIAYYRYQEGAEQSELWMMNADGSDPQMLLEFEGEGSSPPVWSPDGVYVAFAAGNENNTDVWLLALGTGDNIVLNQAVGKYELISWSPDSSALIYMEDTSSFANIVHIQWFLDGKINHNDAQWAMDNMMWSPVDEIPLPDAD